MLRETYNGAVLAYIGDAVIELYLREKLIAFGITDTGRLSGMAQKLVCAPMQSARMDILLPLLTSEEEAAYRLGRNYKTTGKPRHATAAEYSRATGMEAVFGYLKLTDQISRMTDLLDAAYEEPLCAMRGAI